MHIILGCLSLVRLVSFGLLLTVDDNKMFTAITLIYNDTLRSVNTVSMKVSSISIEDKQQLLLLERNCARRDNDVHQRMNANGSSPYDLFS